MLPSRSHLHVYAACELSICSVHTLFSRESPSLLPRCSSHSNPVFVGPALFPTLTPLPCTLFDLVCLRIRAVHFEIVLNVELYRENCFGTCSVPTGDGGPGRQLSGSISLGRNRQLLLLCPNTDSKSQADPEREPPRSLMVRWG